MTKKKIVTFFKSLKFRLIILFLLFGILPGILLRAGMLQAYEKKAVSNRSIDILSQAKILANRVVADDYLHNSTSEVINAQLDQLSTIYDGRVILIDDTFRIVKDWIRIRRSFPRKSCRVFTERKCRTTIRKTVISR